MKIELGKRDLLLLVQSLEHCLATCQAKPREGQPACEDCEAAKELKERLTTALKEVNA